MEKAHVSVCGVFRRESISQRHWQHSYNRVQLSNALYTGVYPYVVVIFSHLILAFRGSNISAHGIQTFKFTSHSLQLPELQSFSPAVLSSQPSHCLR